MYTLYDYQEKAAEKVIKGLTNKSVALMVMAMGLGKTITSGMIARRILKSANCKKVLFLCHENDILEQAEKMYREILDRNLSFRIFYGTGKDWAADQADVVFASFQSMRKWYQAFDQDHFDFVIVDESHHGPAPTYKEVIDYFTSKMKLGMTGTPDREDEQDIREIFGKEVVNYPLEMAIAKGWLSQVEYYLLNDGINNRKLRDIFRGVFEKGRRLSVTQLNETIFIKTRDKEQVKIIKSYSQNKKVMIFCENIEHANNFVRSFKGARVVHSKMPNRKNKEALSDFRENKFQYIVSVNKLNEGIDIPDAGVVVFLRATDSKNIFFQQLGRGLRKTATKNKVIVLDFVANCERLIMVKELSELITDFLDKEGGTEFNLSKTKLRISGKAFDFIFTEEFINILDVIRILREGFYKTVEEHREAAKKLGIKTGEEYRSRYKEDLKLLSPTSLAKLSDFHGWLEFFNGTEVKQAPVGWKNEFAISLDKNLTISYLSLMNFVKPYRKTHPHFFAEHLTSRNKLVEYYHPELIQKIVRKFTKLKPEAGWKSMNSLLIEIGYSAKNRKKINEIIDIFNDQVKKENIKSFHVSGHLIKHYSPSLSKKILIIFRERNK